MRNERGARTFLLRRVPGSAWLTIAIVATGGLLVIWWLVDGQGVSTVATSSPGASDVSTTDTVSDAASPEIQLTGDSQAVGAPTPEAVLADPQCRMVVGQRTASDTALVYLPLGDGAWFAVVNTFGVVFDGTLPFAPERPVVGKRPDGTILAGFGLEGEVQVVHDGSVIYEFDDVWRFDIADDGSSFFVVEPLAGDASRLVLYNLELREEHHFDLGTTVARTDRVLDSDLGYSDDLAEVKVVPRPGRATPSRFYPVGGGEHREVVVHRRDGGVPTAVSVFESSQVGYHAYLGGDAESYRNRYGWIVAKVRREFVRGGATASEVWTRDLIAIGPLSMQLSQDGAWLVVSGAVSVFVFNTVDGTPVFTYPPNRLVGYRVDNNEPVVHPPRDEQRRIRRASGRFVGDRLLVRRWTEGSPDEFQLKEFQPVQAAGEFRMVEQRDVQRVRDESELAFLIRTELDPRNPIPCTDHAILDQRLEIRDGRLTYQRRVAGR